MCVSLDAEGSNAPSLQIGLINKLTSLYFLMFPFQRHSATFETTIHFLEESLILYILPTCEASPSR